MAGSFSRTYLKQQYMEGSLQRLRHAGDSPLVWVRQHAPNVVDGGKETNQRFVLKAKYAF